MTIKFRLFDQVVYLIILAESILSYANIHYLKNLEAVGSIMFFIFNFMFFFVVYQGLLLFWDKYLKNEIQGIIAYFCRKGDGNRTNAIMIGQGHDVTNIPGTEGKEVDEEILSLDLQYRYVMHYIGTFIEEEGQERLKENLRLMAYENEIKESITPFKQICKGSLSAFDQKDINHLGHAIGNHTLRRRKIHEIAIFLKCCFPQVYKDTSLSGIAQKLTSMEYSNSKRMIIPVADKSIPLPYFDE